MEEYQEIGLGNIMDMPECLIRSYGERSDGG